MAESEIQKKPGGGLRFPLYKYFRVIKPSPSSLCNDQCVGVMLEVGKKPRAFVVLSGGVRRGIGDLL